MPTAVVQEIREVHTRLLRLGLAAEESRSWWVHVDPDQSQEETLRRAFEERWFGSRSMTRVRYIVVNLAWRFQTFPEALEVLRKWRPAEVGDRSQVCHLHLQLTDPLYRSFTGEYLPRLRQHPTPRVDRDSVSRWLDQLVEGRWAPATSLRMANGLLASATEAGLCEGSKATRPLRLPAVSDRALGYSLHLLRRVEFEGNLSRNPYLASLGLEGEVLEGRLRRVPGVSYRRLAGVQELEWQYPDLASWAAGVLP